MHFGVSKFATGVLFVAALGCQAAVPETSEDTAAVLGSITTHSCTVAQATALQRAWLYARSFVAQPEFQACVTARMTYDYIPCGNEGESFWDHPRAEQVQRVLDMSHSANALDATCASLGGNIGFSQFSNYFDTSPEAMQIERTFIDQFTGSPHQPSDYAELAGTMWHEAAHRHGYHHTDSISDYCGYPQGDQFTRSVNGILDSCLSNTAGAASVRVSLGNNFGHLAPGVYSDAGHDLPIVGTINATVPPGVQLTTCSSATLDGDGRPSCNGPSVPSDPRFRDRQLGADPFHTFDPAEFAQVQPLALAFTLTSYAGDIWPLGEGPHTSGVEFPDNRISSIYAPSGVAVTACPNGPTGGGCATFDAPVSNVWLGGISYIEVQPRAVLYSMPEFLGTRSVFNVGQYSGSDTRVSFATSMILPPTLNARVCYTSSAVPGGTCTTIHNSIRDLVARFGAGASITSLTISHVGTPAPACVPTTCAATGSNCGTIPDGCGGTLNCGTCSGGSTCGGGGIPHVCGGCVPNPNPCNGLVCGSVSDGCGGTVSCGTCNGKCCGGEACVCSTCSCP
jgi:hypothetical protein